MTSMFFVVNAQGAKEAFRQKYSSIRLGNNAFEKLDYLATKNSKVKQMVEECQSLETGLLAIDLKIAQEIVDKDTQNNSKILPTKKDILNISADVKDELSWRLKPATIKQNVTISN